ncbi:MAG: NnrS family protein [Sterolibacteriaceae bacterium]|uniref:NnrS family protein n=1 Tax=Candidatus Methylophosphatis roskildensis TaxID=2899263 RepID=A0A9D7DZ53_9PROT|nr:NnrS family protein [Candidatus Methylophosphatis roskildensis]
MLSFAQLGGPRPQRNVLFAAPHRVMFLSGAIQTIAAFAWWAWLLLARIGGLPMPELPWPGSWLHGAFAVYGVFPFFVFGFLMTAMPRWQGQGEIGGRPYLLSWALLTAGWAMFHGGLLWPALLAPALWVVLAGWIAGVLILAEVAFAPGADRRHALHAWAALAAGVPGLICLIGYASFGWLAGPRFAEAIGVWACLVPLFIVVCHRMVPFFSANVIPKYQMVRPYWALAVLLGASIVHLLLQVGELPTWLWLPDGAMAAIASWLSWRWQLRASFRARLLAMLHVGFLWLPAALWLSVGQSLALAAGHPMLGLASLHALSIGFFGSMLVAMVSRVTLGHSGRTLQADAATWRLFLGLQTVALLRVAAELSQSAYNVLVAATAVVWLLIFGLWCTKMIPICLKPRTDGRPG